MSKFEKPNKVLKTDTFLEGLDHNALNDRKNNCKIVTVIFLHFTRQNIFASNIKAKNDDRTNFA